MKTTYVMYDPAVWNTNTGGFYLDCTEPWADHMRSRGVPLYTEAELAELEATGSLDRMSDADRETLFREARSVRGSTPSDARASVMSADEMKTRKIS